MIKYFPYEGNPNILRAVRIGDDGRINVCVVLGVAKMLKNIGLIQRVPAGKENTWLIITFSHRRGEPGMRIREVDCEAAAKQWFLDQYGEEG